MTDQEVFDKVATHLLTQQRKSQTVSSGIPSCLYRGPDGTMCAVGCLIPDSLYDPDIEGDLDTILNDPENGDQRAVGDFIRREGMNEELLGRLQSLHDDGDVFEWPSALRETAAEQGLSWAVVDQLAPLGQPFPPQPVTT